MFKNKNYFYIILCIIILFHGVNNYVWLGKNKIPPFWDEGRYLLMELKYRDLFLHFPSFNFKSFVEIGGYYPPLFPISSLILTCLFGNSIRTAVMTNIIYMVIMLFSAFKIGEMIFDRKAGLWAAFILSMFPIIFGTSRMFLLDYALSAMVTLSIYLLLSTDYFKNTKYSIFFGISLGLGFLTKNTFGVFIIGPLIYVFYSGVLRRSKENRRKQIINLFYSLGLGGILCIPWYVLSFPYARWKLIPLGKIILKPFLHFYYLPLGIFLLFIISKFYKFNIFTKKYLKWWLLILCLLLGLGCLINKMVLLSRLWIVSRGLWYFFLLKDQIGLFFLLIFIFVVPQVMRQKSKNKHILTLWVIISYCLMIFFVSKDFRYTMPYLPAIAIILAVGILRIRRTLPSVLLFSLILIFCFVQFFILSFNLSYDPHNIYFKNRFIRYIIAPNPCNYWLIHSSVKGDFRTEETLRWIKDDGGEEKKSVGLLVDVAPMNIEAFRYYVYRNKLPLKIVSCTDNNGNNPKNFTLDYLVTLKNLELEGWPWTKKTMYRLNEQLKRNSDKYGMVKEFELPYYWDIGRNNKIYIYTRKKDK